MMILIAQAVMSGLALGAIYALAASGLGIIFGLFGVINFAHTQNMMMAAVVAISVARRQDSFHLGHRDRNIGCSGRSESLVERLFIRPLLSHETAQIDTLFITLGLSIVIENGMLLLWGSQPKYFDSSLQGIVEFGGVILPSTVWSQWSRAAVVFLILHLLATRTRIGKSVLATAQNPRRAHHRHPGRPSEAHGVRSRLRAGGTWRRAVGDDLFGELFDWRNLPNLFVRTGRDERARKYHRILICSSCSG